MIRHCVRVDGTGSDHTHAQYATPAPNSCPTDIIYVCAGRTNCLRGIAYNTVPSASPIQLGRRSVPHCDLENFEHRKTRLLPVGQWIFWDCMWWWSPVSSLTTHFFKNLNTYKWWQVNCTNLCIQNLLAACHGMNPSYKFEMSVESKLYRYEFGSLPVWISVDLSTLRPFVLVRPILNGRPPPPAISL
jgi:hypothetical protein